VSFPIQPDGQGVLLLSAVRWYWDHGHWDTTHADRLWDATFQDAYQAQITLDEYIDDCAREVESEVVSRMQRGPLDPAAAAVAVRTVALRALGAFTASEGSPITLEAVLSGEGLPGSASPSAAWQDVADAATGVLRDVDSSWIAAFATARQGDTGEPQAVDASRLLPIAQRAYLDPMGVLRPEAQFDDSFASLGQAWRHLANALATCADSEASALATTLLGIKERIGEESIEAVVAAVRTAGLMAADQASFRPIDRYPQFRDACDRLEHLTHSDVATWLSAEPALVGRDANSLIPVLDAQRWASHARQVSSDLDLVYECLGQTTAEIDERLIQDVGASPRSLIDEIAEILAQIRDLLEPVAGEGNHK
jgi:hypothetical protein